ncbi:MAG: hypothetical protein KC431_28020, partial [Myxococcales bacterium]|nr:hypothetical protein [Myxococcales bacterium]
ERDRAYGVELHVATIGIRPKRMAAPWIGGERWLSLGPALRALTAGSEVAMTDDDAFALRVVVDDEGPALLLAQRTRTGAAAPTERVRLASGQLAALIEFVDEVARRL